ncbi:hypothetical protein ApAK_06020 [Thermoplasmatales archaeon AK]|nr:hypothetical protein [Thermoplasmatales archaeon AK]
MRLDARMLYEVMSQFHSIGDEEYGGQGTFQEAILVGYIYGLLTENPLSTLRDEAEYRKIYNFGGFCYIIWFEEIVAEDKINKDEPGYYEIRVENLEEDDADPILIPVAVEGPYSEEDIEGFLRNGEL